MEATTIRAVLEAHYSFKKVSTPTRISAGVSNENYVFNDGAEKYIARVCIFEPENQLQAMIPFLKHAEEVGYPAPRVIQTADGDDFVRHEGQPLVVTSFLDGSTIDPKILTAEHVRSLAYLLARFHSLDWQPPNTPITLDPDYIFGVYNAAKDYSPDGNENITRLIDLVDIYYRKFKEEDFTNLSKQLPQGITHGDVIPGNVLFSGIKAVSLLDFEELGTSWQLQDIAMTLNTWMHQNGAFRSGYIQLFLDAYSSVRPITDFENDNLERAMKFIAFRQCAYAKQMLLHGRIHTVDNFSSYWTLRHLHEHGLQI